MINFFKNLFKKEKEEEKPLEYDIFGLIKKWEGLRLEAYLCPARVPTIGYGNTYYKDGTKVKLGDKITEEQADDLLAWYCLNEIRLPKGTFNPKQKMALYSILYNVGCSFLKSKCCKAIENEEWETAFKDWDWVKAGGKVLKGLQRRRKEERALFFDGLIDVDLLEDKYFRM